MLTGRALTALALTLSLSAIAGCGSDDSTGAKHTGGSGGKGGSGAAGSGGSPTGGTSSGGTGGGAGATGGSSTGGSASGCVPKSTGFITDLGNHSEPAPPSLANAGESVQDPIFGTTISRITDANDGTDCTNAYSYWPTFNTASTRLFLNCSGTASLYDFDPATAKASNKRDLFTKTPNGTTPGWEDAIWSHSDPN